MWRRQYNPFYLWQQQREKQQQLKAAERERDSILHEFRGIKRKINHLDVMLPYAGSYENYKNVSTIDIQNILDDLGNLDQRYSRYQSRFSGTMLVGNTPLSEWIFRSFNKLVETYEKIYVFVHEERARRKPVSRPVRDNSRPSSAPTRTAGENSTKKILTREQYARTLVRNRNTPSLLSSPNSGGSRLFNALERLHKYGKNLPERPSSARKATKKNDFSNTLSRFQRTRNINQRARNFSIENLVNIKNEIVTLKKLLGTRALDNLELGLNKAVNRKLALASYKNLSNMKNVLSRRSGANDDTIHSILGKIQSIQAQRESNLIKSTKKSRCTNGGINSYAL